MGIKRKNTLTADFNMSSMTDMIFLLLIFFMITSTVVTPNAIKVILPQSAQQTDAKPLSRVTIDKDLKYYVAYGNDKEKRVDFEGIVPFLQKCYAENNEMFVALYADETIPYKEVVKLLDIANRNHFKMILITRPQ
ncbi:MAG: biopolymer transporter ExbD [Candidatus Symbiothrix sp.]|jgi:biopolymer transport protein ExbD|nr:biopolymer transporter ExbD [Candidatus Symbiothrix sp.]